MTPADEAAELLAAMRDRVEEASGRLSGLADEVGALRAREDDLETMVDLLLDQATATVLVIDAERRITGLSRAAADRLEGAALGKPLSSAVGADEFDLIAAQLDDTASGPPPDGPRVDRLPSGGAVVTLVGP
jgi:hypothetical protein